MTASMSKAVAVSDIAVELIDVMPGRRKVDPLWAEAIAEDFRTSGQHTPIDLVIMDDRFRLVAGGHRLAAAKLCLWPTIRAFAKHPEDYASDAEITLHEIKENLVRRQLSVLDKAFDLARWRNAYNAAHIVSKGGRRRADANEEELTAKFAVSFTVASQQAFGLSERSIFNAIKIASIPGQIRERIALHAVADNQSELLQLAAEPAGRQDSIVALLTAEPPQAANVAEAIAAIDRLPAPTKQPGWEKLSDAFSRLKTRDQERFFELHYAAITLWLEGREE